MMVDPTTGQPALSRILDNQERLQDSMNKVEISLGRMETQVETLIYQRGEQHTDHLGCRQSIDHELEKLAHEVELVADKVDRVTTWFRAVAVLGAIFIAVLTILNILMAIGVRI